MSDLPDFTNYSQVDLVQQTIAFLTNRPMYGEAKRVSGQKEISAGSTVNLAEITGKGKIYTGIVYISTSHTVENDVIEMYIDENIIFSRWWKQLLDYNMTRAFDYVVWLSCYDDVNYKYMLNLMSDITFEEKLRLKYHNASSDSVIVLYNLIYTLLQT